MKKRIIIVFSIFAVLFCLSSCSNSSSSDDYTTYKIEIGVVSNSTYSTALSRISGWTGVSYSNIAALRLYLYNNTISNHDVQTGVSIDEIKSFLLSKGMSNYEVASEIELLNRVGNNIIFGEYAIDSTKKVWIYATK